MDLVLLIVGVLFTAWLLVSLFVFCYWFFRPAVGFWASHKYVYGLIRIGAFLASGLVIMKGVEQLLWFLPGNWTYENQEGEPVLIKQAVQGMIGFIASCFLQVLFDKMQSIRSENKRLATACASAEEIVKRNKDLLEQSDNDSDFEPDEFEESPQERKPKRVISEEAYQAAKKRLRERHPEWRDDRRNG